MHPRVVGKKAPAKTRSMVSSVTGFSHKQLPIKYFGVPMVSGRFRVAYFNYIVDKILKRIEGWRSSLLSAGGRLILIKHVLTSIPIYTLSCLPIPKGNNN
jgi:hypothetical protein